jgi:hypothetical protein
MAVARNMKDVEKMILKAAKDVITESIKSYTTKWYAENEEAEKFITKDKLQEIANQTVTFDMSKNEFQTSIDITKYVAYGLDKHEDLMNKFNEGLLEYVSLEFGKRFS